jgi:hypothetical protein
MHRLILASLMALGVATPALAEPVDLELVLLADASGSIDEEEIRFQRENYAIALQHPEILTAIRVGGYLGKIAVSFVEWGDMVHQDVVVPWTVIDGPESATAFGEALRAAPRRAFGGNAIGQALSFATDHIERNDLDGERKVIDLSADSAANFSGLSIAEGRAIALAAGITINGLAIACRHCSGRPIAYDLEDRFAREIIGGPGSFVVSAESRENFAEAVRRKLLLEIAAVEVD